MRPIDADALKIKIQKIKAEALEHGFAPESICGDILLNFLDNAPTIEAKPVVHAYWKYYKSARFFQCSRRGGPVVSDGYSYCPHCGAQKDEEKNN